MDFNSSKLILLAFIYLSNFHQISCQKKDCSKYGYLDEENNKCVIKVLGDCDSESIRSLGYSCPDYATCKIISKSSNSYSFYEFCRCAYGYAASEDLKTCIPEQMHGEKCHVTDVLISAGRFTSDSCNKLAGLKCTDGFCTCEQDPDDEEEYKLWSEVGKQCLPCHRILKDSFWDTTSQNCKIKVNRACADHPDKCPANSKCSPSIWDASYSTCQCDEGYRQRYEGEGCDKIKQFGEICHQPGAICNPGSEMSCKDGLCTCENPRAWVPEKNKCVDCEFDIKNSFYDENTEQCRLKLNMDCTDASGICGQNAFCKEDNDGGKTCQCKEGYMEDWNYNSCVKIKSKGETCGKGDRCDRKAKLVCSQEGICGCASDSDGAFKDTFGAIWDSSINKCRHKVRSHCWGFDDQKDECINNAECVDRKCKCKKGYELDKNDATCEGTYLSTCKNSTDCASRRAGLICDGGQCKCKSSFGWDPRENQCLGLSEKYH